MKQKKGELPMWLVGMIIALLMLLIMLVIVAKTGDFHNKFFDFLGRII